MHVLLTLQIGNGLNYCFLNMGEETGLYSDLLKPASVGKPTASPRIVSVRVN